jgi:hypothetical protein
MDGLEDQDQEEGSGEDGGEEAEESQSMFSKAMSAFKIKVSPLGRLGGSHEPPTLSRTAKH